MYGWRERKIKEPDGGEAPKNLLSNLFHQLQAALKYFYVPVAVAHCDAAVTFNKWIRLADFDILYERRNVSVNLT